MRKEYFGAALIAAGLAFAMPSWATGRDCASGDDDHRNRSLRIVGLTADNALVCFNEHAPRFARFIGYVSGLSSDTTLVGIDFRVQDGLLYGVGNAGGVYTLDTDNAHATLVNRLTVALTGTAFGVDFNPAADRLRIVSNTGQNLRHNVNAGGVTIGDTVLAYTVGTPALGVVGAAYTNNDLDATTATTLFDLDVSLDQIALQSPANSGMLVATGKLNIDVTNAGLDIYSMLIDGATRANRGYAALVDTTGESALYRVNALTGDADRIGGFRHAVIDIAIPLNQ